jgi:copper chaperone NosL
MATRRSWLLARPAALGAALALLLTLAGCAPEGPADVAWDKVACAHCKMLVSDPRFAAQLRLEGGEFLFFDDPGCLLRARAAQARPVAAVWFHDSAGEGWLAEREVAFVRVSESPMGYGLAAVRVGSAANALDLAAALRALEERP